MVQHLRTMLAVKGYFLMGAQKDQKNFMYKHSHKWLEILVDIGEFLINFGGLNPCRAPQAHMH